MALETGAEIQKSMDVIQHARERGQVEVLYVLGAQREAVWCESVSLEVQKRGPKLAFKGVHR